MQARILYNKYIYPAIIPEFSTIGDRDMKINRRIASFLAIVMIITAVLAACDRVPDEHETESSFGTTEGTTAEQTTEAKNDGNETYGTTETDEPDETETEATEGETEETETDAEGDIALSLEQAIALGLSQAHNQYTKGKYYVCGTVKSIFSKSNGNMVIVDGEGRELTLYGTFSADGQIKYADMADKPVVGDEIVVYGIIGQYNGAARMKDGWIVSRESPEPETDGDETTDGEVTQEVTEPLPDESFETDSDVTDTLATEGETNAPENTEGETCAPEITESVVDVPEITEGETDTDDTDSGESEESATTETETSQTDTEECTHAWSEYVENAEGHSRYCTECSETDSGEHVASEDLKGDGEGHWNPCIYCGAKLGQEEHSEILHNVDGKKHSLVCEVCETVLYTENHDFKCTELRVSHECDCGAVESCPATDTEYKINDTYHWKISCDVCGIEDERAEHNWIYVPKTRYCKDCQYTQECNDDHMGYDKEFHWIEESCEICRISPDGEQYAHGGKSVKIIRGEKYDTYALTCDSCSYCYESRSVPSGVNYFASPVHLYNNWNCDTSNNGSPGPIGTLMHDEDETYARIKLYGGASFEFANMSFVKGFVADEEIRGGSGRLAVIKLRAHEVGFISLALNSNTSSDANVNFDPGKEPYRNDRKAANIPHDEWITYVIDLEKLGCEQYTANDASVTAISFGMFFNGHVTDGSAYIDIEFAAICDSWQEVEGLVGEGRKVFYTSWTSTADDQVRMSSGTYLASCAGECKPQLKIVGDRYIYSCSSCNSHIETRRIGVGADGVNYYSAPSATQIYNNWNTGENGGSKAYSGELRIFEDSFVYNRITLQNGGSFEFTNGTSEVVKGFGTVDDVIYGSGAYMVIKLRLGAGEEMLKLCAWDGRTADRGGDPIFDGGTQRTADAQSREWTVYVIEIASLFESTDYAANDKTVNKAVFGVKGDYNGGKLNGSSIENYDETDYVDIAYFAICDDWREVSEVVAGEEVVLFTGWSNKVNSNVWVKPDGTTLENR